MCETLAGFAGDPVAAGGRSDACAAVPSSLVSSSLAGCLAGGATGRGGFLLQSLLALALALGALRRLPPVPVVAVADVTVVHLHFNAGGNYCGSCKAIWTCKNTRK